MPRKSDPLDAAKITSSGKSIEMQEIIPIPARRGRQKKSEESKPISPVEEKVVAAVAEAPKVEEIPAPILPAKQYDTYVIVKDAKAWINGQLIYFAAGKKVNQISHGPNFLKKLQDQNVELKLVEE